MQDQRFPLSKRLSGLNGIAPTQLFTFALEELTGAIPPPDPVEEAIHGVALLAIVTSVFVEGTLQTRTLFRNAMRRVWL